MQHTLHWGQASKSNPGLLFRPERISAPSTHTSTTEEGKEVQEGWMKNERRWRGSEEEGGGVKEDGGSG